jgi:hypothetical protein
MKTLPLIVALLLSGPGLCAQVAPSATSASNSFNYALRYSQSAQFGGSYGNWHTAAPSAEMQYASRAKRAPFNLHYAGGYSWTLAGPEYSTGWFQRLSVGQVISVGKWQASLSDDVSYLPQAPVTGFLGIPGIGEPIGTPTPPSSNQTVLTLGTYALNNDSSVNVSRILTGAYSMGAEGAYALLRFPDGNGLDTNTASVQGHLTRRLNARNRLSAQYIYTGSDYPESNFTFYTNSAMGIYERSWSRSLHTSIALGPLWINNSLPRLIPPSTMLSVDASVNQDFRRQGSFSLNYHRGAGGGSGYMLGQTFDAVSAGYSRDFKRTLTFEMSAGYNRSTPLTQRGVIESEYGGIQVHRHFGPHVSAFINYTLLTQSANMALPGNVVQHPWQTISFGTAFEPRNTSRH